MITRYYTLQVWTVPEGTLLLGPFLHPDLDCFAVAFSADDTRICTLHCSNTPGKMEITQDEFEWTTRGQKLGLDITVIDFSTGDVLLQKTIDTVVDRVELHEVKLEYSADGKYLVVWYWLLPACAGQCYKVLGFPEFKKLTAIDTEIHRNGREVAELPLDFDFMGKITRWDSR
ncbi:hypothetical protein B0H19DRAFT_1267749 [Mycena capillaripes]|nr:hypothetical protein B0H19DRAFT_1267749 [Mycena capillaripes]